MTPSVSSANKCPRCKKLVKDQDSGAISCSKCADWFHGPCCGVTVEEVALMGKIHNCFWICDPCIDDTVFRKQDKLDTFIAKSETFENEFAKINEKLAQLSATSSHNPVLPNKPREHTIPQRELEIRLQGVPECTEASSAARLAHEENEVKSVLHALHETEHACISSIRRLGKFDKGNKRPRSLIVRFTNEWTARKCLAKGGLLKTYKDPVYISKVLSAEEFAIEKQILKKRYELIQHSDIDKSRLKIRNLTLLLDGEPVKLDS